MTFEELKPPHFDEWGMGFQPTPGAYTGFVARHDDGSLAALICFYAHAGDWWAAMARRGAYTSKLHQEVWRGLDAIRDAGGECIHAVPDPAVPRSLDYMLRLGFRPEGETYVPRRN